MHSVRASSDSDHGSKSNFSSSRSSSNASSSSLPAVLLVLVVLVVVEEASSDDFCHAFLFGLRGSSPRHANSLSSCRCGTSLVGHPSCCLSSSDSKTTNDFCRWRTFHCSDSCNDVNQSLLGSVRHTVGTGYLDARIFT